MLQEQSLPIQNMLHSNSNPTSMFQFDFPSPTRFLELPPSPLVTDNPSNSSPVNILVTESPVIPGVTPLEPVTTAVPHLDGTIDKNTATALTINNQQESPLMVNTKDILILTPAQHLMLNNFLEYLDAYDRVNIADQLNPLIVYDLDLKKYTPNLDTATRDNVKLLEEIDKVLKIDNLDLKNNKLVKKVIKLFKFSSK